MKYEVIVHNNDVGEGETNSNIQFFANTNWVNIPSGEKTEISETALENLWNCRQKRRRVNSKGELEEYWYTRFPVTVLNAKYSVKEIKDGIPYKNLKRDAEYLGIKPKELAEREEYQKPEKVA